MERERPEATIIGDARNQPLLQKYGGTDAFPGEAGRILSQLT
jgi:hypothetical protein